LASSQAKKPRKIVALGHVTRRVRQDCPATFLGRVGAGRWAIGTFGRIDWLSTLRQRLAALTKGAKRAVNQKRFANRRL
jgi:hypothetical protein